jgi:hypothetical protein
VTLINRIGISWGDGNKKWSDGVLEQWSNEKEQKQRVPEANSKEYLNFLNIALGSLDESVSGLFGYVNAKQISNAQFEKLDSLAYKLENELLKLVESLERKRDKGDWIDSLVVKESNAAHGDD